MKRSSAVNLILITSVAASMTACSKKPTRYCVDADNQVVDDRDCQNNQAQQNQTYHWFHWYYVRTHGAIAPGTMLSGGSSVEPSGGFTTPADSGTMRGGIGEAGESASGHAGEGGGGE